MFNYLVNGFENDPRTIILCTIISCIINFASYSLLILPEFRKRKKIDENNSVIFKEIKDKVDHILNILYANQFITPKGMTKNKT